MPATVIDDPLGVEFVFDEGKRWLVRLDELPNAKLAAELAVGLAANAHPHGGITAQKTVLHYASSLRCMVRDLVDQGFDGSAADLTRAELMRYWLANSPQREMYSRMLLKGLDRVTGMLRSEVREYLNGNSIKKKKPTTPNRPYSDGEWERLETACRAVADDAWSRHREMLALAATGRDPRISGHNSREDMAALLLQRGPMAFEHYVDYIHGHVKWTWDDHPYRQLRAVREALFPPRPVQTAYSTLFGIYCGVVPDGIDGLRMEGMDWAGDKTVTITYEKGRTARESVTLPNRAMRLLDRWLKHSAPLRRFADELAGELWIASNPERGVLAVSHTGAPQRKFVKTLELKDDQGETFAINRGRIRATYEERLARRGWTGAVTIDPNHSPRIEGDHYVTPRTPQRLEAVESIIEDGMAQVLRKALPPVVLAVEQAAELAERFPQEIARLGLDGPAIAELVGGERDVFTAACADQLAGLHGPAGQPCPARPWVCLLCPLAVFMPRHAPNLIRLDSFFLRQFRQMTVDQYLRVFGPYAERLTNEILPKIASEVREAARAQVSGDDHELPLRPEEATV